MIATSTDVSISIKTAVPGDVQAIVLFVPQGATSIDAPAAGGDAIASANRLVSAGVARGKAKQVVFDLIETGRLIRRVYVVGLGPSEKINAESFRIAGGTVTKALRKHKLSRAAFILPGNVKIDLATAAEAIVTGLLLASFDYREYKGVVSRKKDESDGLKPNRLMATVVASNAQAKAIEPAIDRARAICDGQNFCRTVGFRPGNDVNPVTLAKIANEMAGEVGLNYRVFDEKQLARLGMGGILAVGAGSIATPPRLIVLEHKPAAGSRRGGGGSRVHKQSAPLLLIGKSITFDTGGISIKAADKMGKMIFDKCGGMAVLGLMYAVAKLSLPVHVVGILSSAENAISSRAYRPGDILRMYNGVTVEVTNTDAEGRLVLGDALAWGIETYKPAAVIDLATLTGGVIVALGKTMAGVMSNDDGLVSELNQASEAAGEKIWRLPLGDDQREQIKSDPADIVNSAGREGHPLQGGAFLSYFVPRDDSVPWAHLDIAGVADTEKDLPYYAKGPTGWGVRTLVNWVTARCGGLV